MRTGESRAGILPGQRVLAGVCVVVAAMTALIPQAAAPAIPAMAQRFAAEGDGKLFAQLALSAPALMMIFGAPIAGTLAERFGHRVTLLVSLLFFLIGGAGVLFIDNATTLIVLRLLLGMAGGGLYAIGLALMSENFEGHARERLFGFVVLVAASLAACSNTIGGALVDCWGWRAPFGLYLLSLPVFFAAWRVVRDPIRANHAERAAQAGSFRQLTPMVPYYLLLILLTIGIFIPYIQAGFVLEERGIASAAIRGGIISITALFSGLSGVIYGLLRRRLSARSVMAMNALTIGTGSLVIAFAPSAWGVMLGCAIAGFGAGMCAPASASLAVNLTPAPLHAFALGLSFSALSLGQFLNPILLAPLRAYFGAAAAFAILGATLVAFGLIIVRSRIRERVTRRRHAHKEAALE